ncbi:MAG: hypothetical protein ACOYLX_21220 [Burkholderiaceae bacterium]
MSTADRRGFCARLAAAGLAFGAGSARAQAPSAGSPGAETDSERRLRALMSGRAADGDPASPERERERLAWLAKGEAALERLDVAAALAAFERAAGMLHAADAEMGLVRTWMQGGEYRRALAFVAHTAVAHRDAAGGSALYAWLLRVGGQGDASRRMLVDAREKFGPDPILEAASAQLASASPRAAGALLVPPMRAAPYGGAVPRGTRVVASGVLLDEGRAAIAPARALGRANRVWVRDGLGETREARVTRRLPELGLVLLAPSTSKSPAPVMQRAPRDAFPGSIAYVVEQAARDDAVPAWPVLHAGFLGRGDAPSALSPLGVVLPAGPRGGAVFDAAGRLTGVTMVDDGGADRLVPVSRLVDALGPRPLPAPMDGPASARAPLDAIYEAALRATVQVIAAT